MWSFLSSVFACTLIFHIHIQSNCRFDGHHYLILFIILDAFLFFIFIYFVLDILGLFNTETEFMNFFSLVNYFVCYLNLKLADTSKLPTSSTCFNLLKLPAYTSALKLRDQLMVALRFGTHGFSFSWWIKPVSSADQVFFFDM